ncbi:MAG: hypothetical protein ACYS1A_09480 [Planctomycetota bacterium]|jgi:hypothetical protein
MVLEHKDNQEGISKDDFLDSLISEIDGLFEQDGGLNKFQGQFDNFCFAVESYGTELDKYRQLANDRFNDFANKNSEVQKLLEDYNKLLLLEKSERLGKIQLLYIRQCPGPPSENPRWVSDYSLDYIAKDNPFDSIPVYRPPLLELPVNPVFWFFNEMAHYLHDTDPIKQPDEKELLMCDFVRLAVIHDESCSYNKNIMVYKNKNYEGKFERNSFTKDLWEAYKNPEKDDFISTHRRILKQALQHVKTDLGQGETGKKKDVDIREGRDTYIANQMSFGDEAQHTGENINTITSGSEKGKGIWERIKKFRLLLGIIVSLIAIFGGYNKYVRRNEPGPSVPAIVVKLSNSSEENVIVAERGDFIVWFPGPDSYHTMGKYEFRRPDGEHSPTGSFTIKPNETITVMAHVMNVSVYAKILSRADCDFSLLIARTNAGLTSTNNIAFTREAIGKYYIEADVGKK